MFKKSMGLKIFVLKCRVFVGAPGPASEQKVPHIAFACYSPTKLLKVKYFKSKNEASWSSGAIFLFFCWPGLPVRWCLNPR